MFPSLPTLDWLGCWSVRNARARPRLGVALVLAGVQWEGRLGMNVTAGLPICQGAPSAAIVAKPWRPSPEHLDGRGPNPRRPRRGDRCQDRLDEIACSSFRVGSLGGSNLEKAQR
jgi:hypothetical protein